MTLTAATTAGANTRGPVLEKIWLQHYPAGVPAEINPSEYRSLRELIEQAIATHRDRPCFTCMDRTLTYGDLDVLASRFAAYLQQVARLRKGDRIALMLPNVLQYPVAILGAFRAGLTIVNTNPMYTPRELQHQLHDSGARAILILENFAHTLAEVQRRRAPRHRDRHGRRRPARLPEIDAGQLRAAPREEAGAGVQPARRREP